MKSKYTKDLEALFTVFVIVMALEIIVSIALPAAYVTWPMTWTAVFYVLNIALQVVILIVGDIMFPILINSSKAADRFNAMFPNPEVEAKKRIQKDPRIVQLNDAIKNKEKTIAQAILAEVAADGMVSKEDEAQYQKIIDALPNN
jgi:ribosomal protein S20